MADPPPTRLHIDPPIDQWQVTPRNGRTRPVIATGHQPYLWHPGILAKDLAADLFAQHVGGTAMHVVVEHNAIAPLAIGLPTQQGSELSGQTLIFGNASKAATLPPNRLPPIDAVSVERAISGAGCLATETARNGLHRIAEAYAEQGDHPHRSAQTTAVLAQLKRPYLKATMPTLSTSELVTQHFVDRLLADPVGCVRCYNRAAYAYPEAGIRPLYHGRDVVEAPLWAQGDANATPVFVDLGDSQQSLLFTQGQALDLTGPDALRYLRPRAISLSAIMRSEHCDLFIHGTGGGVYDQVTERWWRDWVGEDLAPMAVVSADMFLPFDAPTSTREERIKTQWFAHHLPHNIDRHTDADSDAEVILRQEKQNLLDHMDDDRDKRRRAAAFQRIHAINAELGSRHDAALLDASQQASDARIGVANAVIANRRDWCFALYPEQRLVDLRQRIIESLNRKA
jgi:hypothetical protein